MTDALPVPSPLDFVGADGLLSDEDRQVRDTVRRFVEDQVLPDIADWYERGVFPRDLVKQMGALGLLGMHLDGHGCPGATALQYGLACLELEAGDSALRSFVSVQGSLAMFAIRRYGTEDQQRQWLPGMATGELIGCFALTEHDTGSDPSAMTTTARRAGGDWVLHGTKMWITNGGIADVAIVWARCVDDGTVRGFVVPTATTGVSAVAIPHKLSLRASVTSELMLQDVRLPDDAVLPGAEGMRAPLSCLDEARYGILWGAVGAARTCYASALDYALQRAQFGRPIAGFQLSQQKLVDMMVDVNKGMLLALHLARLKDQGRLHPSLISFGKLDNVRMARRTAATARGLHGANGITGEYPVMRHAANLESVYTYEGTNEIHTLVLGQTLTGIPAFR